MRNRILGPTLLLLFVVTLKGQDCDAILRHGIRNVQVSKSTEASVAMRYFNHCSKSFALMSDENMGSIEVEVFGFGGGSGGMTRKQREERLTDWCQQNRETAQAYKDLYNESQTIYGDAVAAWDRCNKLKSTDVQIEPQISPDARTVDLRVRYTGPTKGVQLTGVEQESFACIIQVPTPKGIKGFDPRTPTLIGPAAINVHCTRSAPTNVVRDGTTYRLTPRGTISILTAGQSLQLFFAEEWDPTLPVKDAALFKKEIADLKNALKISETERSKLAQTVSDLGTLANSSRGRLDVQERGTRFILADACPAGWRDLGVGGLIMYKQHYKNNPFGGGGDHGTDWQWTHPHICRKD